MYNVYFQIYKLILLLVIEFILCNKYNIIKYMVIFNLNLINIFKRKTTFTK